MKSRQHQRSKWVFLGLFILALLIALGGYLLFEASHYQVGVLYFVYIAGPLAALLLAGNFSSRYRQAWRTKKNEGLLTLILTQLGVALLGVIVASPLLLAINAATDSGEETVIRGTLQSERWGRGYVQTFMLVTDDGPLKIEVTEEEAERYRSGDQVALSRRLGGLGLLYRFRWDD